MARKFLYLVALVVVLVIAGLFALRIWSNELTRFVFVPGGAFVEQQPLPANAYQAPAMWISRPGIGTRDPARWQPANAVPEPGAPPIPDRTPQIAPPRFAVFFIHPTSYLARAHWNAPLDDEVSHVRAQNFVRFMASPFNRASEIWAPRYRQATFGAFLTDAPEAGKATDAAYADVVQAFDFFLSSIDKDVPIILAGHSQGALQLSRLLRERVAGKPLQGRIAVAYAVGWPLSVEHDLPALGLPACATPRQAGCLASWMSFAEPADPSLVLDNFRNSNGFDGKPRGDGAILCFNPLTGGTGGSAPASGNLGTLMLDEKLANGSLETGKIAARCNAEGLLIIGDPPELGPYVFPGNNYHVYDIPLFWANLQADAVRRVEAWKETP